MVEPVYQQIGRRLRDLRVARQLTQDAVGVRLDPPLTRAAVGAIESGKQRLLLHTLLQLADILGVQASELLDGLQVIGSDPLLPILEKSLSGHGVPQNELARIALQVRGGGKKE